MDVEREVEKRGGTKCCREEIDIGGQGQLTLLRGTGREGTEYRIAGGGREALTGSRMHYRRVRCRRKTSNPGCRIRCRCGPGKASCRTFLKEKKRKKGRLHTKRRGKKFRGVLHRCSPLYTGQSRLGKENRSEAGAEEAEGR